MNNKKAGIYYLVMNCTAPVLTAVFLAGTVCWASELKYGAAESFDKSPEVSAVMSCGGLSDTGGVFADLSMPVSEVAVMDTANSGAELVEASGVYIGDEFVGAVADPEDIEKELSGILESYRSDDNVIEADFAVEPDIKQGLYRTEALVDEEDMSQFLTGEKKISSDHTAEIEETLGKISEDPGISTDEKAGQDMSVPDDKDNGEDVTVKESVPVLPVKYVCCEKEEEADGIESYVYNEEHELVPGSYSEKKVNTYEVTYIDGQEIARKLTSTETIGTEHFSPDGDGLYSESLPESAMPSIEFVSPVNGGYVSDPFMSDRNHKGMDIAAPEGTDIYAAASGKVIEAGWNDGGYGNFVMIDHGSGYVTLYAHASEVFVSSGDEVKQGELIAAVGTTGDSTGDHCHFEVRYNGEYLDPDNFI